MKDLISHHDIQKIDEREEMNLEEKGKEFADAIIEAVTLSGAQTQLEDPTDAFESGCYFGVVQGYKRGVNETVNMIIESLPDIFNQIAESGFDMSIDWKERYKKLIYEKYFDIKDNV